MEPPRCHLDQSCLVVQYPRNLWLRSVDLEFIAYSGTANTVVWGKTLLNLQAIVGETKARELMENGLITDRLGWMALVESLYDGEDPLAVGVDLGNNVSDAKVMLWMHEEAILAEWKLYSPGNWTFNQRIPAGKAAKLIVLAMVPDSGPHFCMMDFITEKYQGLKPELVPTSWKEIASQLRRL